RVAEVAARFTLDSLPGKQMAIEAEYNSGSISEEEMSWRKMELEREVDFYGAMDGASKFVSGNVKVGILITLVNIVGGLVVGTTIHGESLQSAVNTYVSLTVGDGLVSQFPALFISTATGLIVTRAVSDGTFADDVSKQFSAQSRVYLIAAIFLFILSILPGFPWYILIPMGVLSALGGIIIGRRQSAELAEAEQKERTEAAREERPAEISPVAPLDPISLELGYGLVPLVDKEKGAELLDRITGIRREAALDLGLVVPRIRIIDNMRLEPSEYCVKIRGVEVGRGQIRMGRYLSINPGGARTEIGGEETRDPAFGLPAKWISEEQREEAERAGYTVVDAPSIIATHLTEIIKRHAHEILGRQEVRSMLDTMRQDYPAVVEEVQGALNVGEVQKVLQGLLREQVSIRNMVVILEALADYATVTKETGFLVEKVRQALGRQISLQYAGDERVLRVLTIEPGLEQEIIDSRVDTSSGVVSALPPDRQRAWIHALSDAVRSVQEQGYLPVVLCSEAARPLVKGSTERELRDLAVLSIPEIVPDIRVESLGEIRLDEQ
ncbi:MAG: flagellar biosynthesis protein FlhA, partial [Spirochaetaceae bacterium]